MPLLVVRDFLYQKEGGRLPIPAPNIPNRVQNFLVHSQREQPA